MTMSWRAARRRGARMLARLLPAAVLPALAVLSAALLPAAPARAQIGSDRYASIVMDARSGSVLTASSPDDLRHPASLTKMMTVYMAFEAMRDGRIHPSTPIPVSADAASRPPSRLGLLPGMTITVEDAILALVTKSANDAAAALGEALGGGSEARFAQIMTMRARSLGMTRTTFRNASGLPDYEQVSTARDMAHLGRRLMYDFPDRFGYFSTPAFHFRGRSHGNHNRLLAEYDGTDGIKTGYVNDSGFNLVASVNRDGVRLVAAVFGGSTGRERDRHMMALLDQGFERMGVAPRAAALVAARPSPSLFAARAAGALAAAPFANPSLWRPQRPAALPARPRAPATALAAAPARGLRLLPYAYAANGSIRPGTTLQALPVPPVRAAAATARPAPRQALAKAAPARRAVVLRVEQGDGGVTAVRRPRPHALPPRATAPKVRPKRP